MEEAAKLSYTQLQDFRGCRRRWFYRYVEGLRPIAPSSARLVGGATHALLAAHYGGEDPAEALPRWKAEARAEYPEIDEEELEAAATVAGEVYDAYARFYSYEPWEVVGVETWAEAEIAPGLVLLGRVDLLVKQDDRLWVVEHKVVSRFAAEERLDNDQQSPIYMTLVPAAGVIYNELKREQPKTGPRFRRTALLKRAPSDLLEELAIVAAEMDRVRAEPRLALRSPGIHCQWCDFALLCDGTPVEELLGFSLIRVRGNSDAAGEGVEA